MVSQIDKINIDALSQNPEWLRHELARRTIHEYVPLVTVEPPPVRHHNLLLDHLDLVCQGKLRRLMVFMPPGGAKSTYASVLFPPFFMGRWPKKNVIGCSHTQELADRFGRKVRNVVASPEYRDIYDFGLSSDSHAAGRWENSEGGEYFAVGVGGSVTGRRADLAVIDDPVKSREAADSETIRNSVWEWYKADFRTRLKPRASIILIQTRWHEDDLSGRILPPDYAGESGEIKANDGEVWTVISIPALSEDAEDILGRKRGESYWPGWFPQDTLEQEKISQGARNWSALYQQRPAPEGGDFFKSDWLNWYDERPSDLKYFGASDYAVVTDSEDFTVHGVVGVDPDENIYIVDWWRDKTDSMVWIETLINLIGRWKPTEWAEEKGQITKSLGPFINKRQRETKTYCFRKQFATHKDKATKAQAIRGRMAQGKVYLPRRAPWSADIVRELLSFPAGKNDDQVDVLGLIGRMLGEMTGNRPAPPDEKPKWELPMTFDEARESVTRGRKHKETIYL